MGVGARRVSERRGSIPPSCTSQNLNFPRLLPIVEGDPGLPSWQEQQEGGDGYPSPVFGHNSSPPSASHILLPPLEPPSHPWASGSHLEAAPPPPTPFANSSLSLVPARGGAEGHLPLPGSFRKLAVHAEARRSRGDRGGRAPDTSSLHNSPRDRVRWPSSNSRGSSTSFGRGPKRRARGPRMAPHRAPRVPPGPARPSAAAPPAWLSRPSSKRRREASLSSQPPPHLALRDPAPSLRGGKSPAAPAAAAEGEGAQPGACCRAPPSTAETSAASSLPMTHTHAAAKSFGTFILGVEEGSDPSSHPDPPPPGCEGTQGSHHQF